MRLIARLFICLLLAAPLTIDAQTGSAPGPGSGVWKTIVGSDSRQLYFRFRERDRLPESVSSPSSQLALDIIGFKPGFALPADHLEISGNQIRFGIHARSVAFIGSVATSTITGEWCESGATSTLLLHLIATPSWMFTRQYPFPPHPYLSEEVRVHNAIANITLAGTLTRPAGSGSFPAVLLLTGQNPQDRDSSDQYHRPFRIWADHLTRRGFAVLRCDDRGVGGSEGSFASATIADFATDAQAGMAYLVSRGDIDPARIGVLGHSEGAIVAPMIASGSNNVSFLVLLAPPVFPMREIWKQQFEPICRRRGADTRQGNIIRRLESKILDFLQTTPVQTFAREEIRGMYSSLLPNLSDHDRKTLGLPRRESEKQEVEAAIDEWLSPWMLFAVRYDPAPALKSVSCPILTLFAGKDESVVPEPNRTRAEELLRSGRCATWSMQTFPELDHGFRHPVIFCATTTFPLTETVATEVLTLAAEWLDATVLRR